MKLSVAYTFEPGLVSKLAQFEDVYEIFGKLDRDFIGGGRSTYTLRLTSKQKLIAAVREAQGKGIHFNYLLNGATLNGIEQTKKGQKKIRSILEFLSRIGVNSLTVASPFLLRLIKKQYPHFAVRISAFAVVDSPRKAKQWQDMGADTLCLSAIACNRDFKTLEAIRKAVSCDLQLIANANCLLNCSHELTHMNMLTQSSRKGDPLKGLCLDYCFLNCSKTRLAEPINYLRSTWIRPEDLSIYEDMGYTNFKILERSCPSSLLLRRVEAYSKRSFKGNLYELIAPIAQISKQSKAPLAQRLRMIRMMFRPATVKVKSVLAMKKYAEAILDQPFEKDVAPLYIDNTKLEGFLSGVQKRNCGELECDLCRYCYDWMDKSMSINESFREDSMAMAEKLDCDALESKHWI